MRRRGRERARARRGRGRGRRCEGAGAGAGEGEGGEGIGEGRPKVKGQGKVGGLAEVDPQIDWAVLPLFFSRVEAQRPPMPHLPQTQRPALALNLS